VFYENLNNILGDNMPRGGKRLGAGAPKGNQNALKHGGRAKVLYGVPLNKRLTRFEYRALCLEQLEQLSVVHELYGESPYLITMYSKHKRRYIGAVEFNERKRQAKANKSNRLFLQYIKVIS
jgi:hypothetical protein